MEAGALEGSGANKGVLLHEVLQITSGRGSRDYDEADVVFDTESALEPAWDEL